MYKIRQGVVESIIIASRNVHPLEFISMLGGRDRVIEELVVVPAHFGESHSSYRLDLVPFDEQIIGTVHSHPSVYNHPSNADLDSFERFGKVHIIISYPYTLNTLRAFDNYGKTMKLQVIE
ncbi:MAG TPA: peptidase [Candidatus Diapherotrites archaeon]|uniref:Peptidase n=1 Tax=Candidatus Iainarchaeum sp. TaxID=3101447 RepID=A0A7J4IWR2_9ARCH|nr:peptidase [Candidatus Diapherotrites archaeon]